MMKNQPPGGHTTKISTTPLQELPPFMLEPLDGHRDRDTEENHKKDTTDMDRSPPESYRQNKLRNDSYLGAIHRENLFIRAGLQNVLLVFITQASNVFFLENTGHNASVTLLEEQIDSCKRVLNVYRYVVMNSRMDPATWEQLLRYHFPYIIISPVNSNDPTHRCCRAE